jgi:hypothetical protein
LQYRCNSEVSNSSPLTCVWLSNWALMWTVIPETNTWLVFWMLLLMKYLYGRPWLSLSKSLELYPGLHQVEMLDKVPSKVTGIQYVWRTAFARLSPLLPSVFFLEISTSRAFIQCFIEFGIMIVCLQST